MNWRGILGVYAGLAIVLAGGWFWVQSSALWALGVSAAGLVVAGLGVAHIVLKRRGPLSPGSKEAKSIREPRATRGKLISSEEDAEADSVAKSRMALIAGRASGRVALGDDPLEDASDSETVENMANLENIESVESAEDVDGVEHAVMEPVQSFAEGSADGLSTDVVGEQPILPEADDVQPAVVSESAEPIEPAAVDGHGRVPDLTGTRVLSATLGAPVLSKRVVSQVSVGEPENDGETVSGIEPDAQPETGSEIVSDVDPDLTSETNENDGVAIADSSAEGTAEAAAVPQWTTEPEPVLEMVSTLEAETGFDSEPVVHDPEAVTLEAAAMEEIGPVSLESLPGFPWTARFIGIWAREVRFACPDDLRGAVIHWQRWADGQPTGTPLIQEATEEFKAMLDVWRESGAEVPGLSSDGWTAGRLSAEAGEDAALAALLPRMLRTPTLVAY